MCPGLNNRNARARSWWEKELEDGNASLHQQSVRKAQRLPRGGREGTTPRLGTVTAMFPAHLLIPSKASAPAPWGRGVCRAHILLPSVSSISHPMRGPQGQGLLLFFFLIYWSLVDLQCCVHFFP